MPWLIVGRVFAILLLLVVVGGLGFVIVRPTSKTTIGAGGKQVILNTEAPKVPLGGCAIWRFNLKLYYEKNFNLQGSK